jgi:ketosteroid isomerase-like protein
MREENLARVGRGFKAFQEGDMGTIRELNDENTVWRTPGIGPFKAEYKGAEGVIEYLTQLFDLSGGTIKVEAEQMYGDDDHVVVLDHITASRNGKDIDFRDVLVYEFADGKVRSITQYELDEKELADFWA